MRGTFALVLACGCNHLFGVESTGLVDAPPPIDSPPPPTCPVGGTLLEFGNELMQIPARYCTNYVQSDVSGEAAALCMTGDGSLNDLGMGPIDESLSPQVLFPPVMLYRYGATLSLSAEGDRVLLHGYDANYAYQTSEYVRTGLQWTFATSYNPTGTTAYYAMSRPSRGPDRRSMISYYDGVGQVIKELGDTGLGWIPLQSYTLADLGTDSVEEPSLSADGLRLVFTSYAPTTTAGGSEPPSPAPPETWPPQRTSEQAVFYTSRDSLGDRFRTAKRLPSVPTGVVSPYVTEDCGRIYFSALNTVWYLKQPITAPGA